MERELKVNFEIDDHKSVGSAFRELGINNWLDASHYVHQLSYGRNSVKNDLTNVLHEKQGTCSTKHALLYQLAEDHGMSSVNLVCGIIHFSPQQFPALQKLFSEKNLEYIPEVHCCLLERGIYWDYTFPEKVTVPSYMIKVHRIKSHQITDHKVNFHKLYLKNWIKKNDLPYSLDEVWSFREQCIQRLSNQ